VTILRTPRLLLRPPTLDDVPAYAAMHADPEVMRYYPKPFTFEESRNEVVRLREHHEKHGFGLWAVEHEGRFIGITGLLRPTWEAHFTPCTEIGWRLERASWGQGFATEAARECLRYAFEVLKVPEVVALTSVPNEPSKRVMERLGMTRDPADDFDHPRLAADSPLKRHVLYRASGPSRGFNPLAQRVKTPRA